MNNQEVVKHHALPTTGLIAHRKALEAAGIMSIFPRSPRDRRSRDQRGCKTDVNRLEQFNASEGGPRPALPEH